MADHPQPKKMPPSVGGGEVSTTAMKLLQRSEFEGIPQPELIAECIVRWLTKKDQRARSGLMAVVKYYEEANRHGRFVSFVRRIMTHE